VHVCVRACVVRFFSRYVSRGEVLVWVWVRQMVV